jgi:hypothetical protein
MAAGRFAPGPLAANFRAALRRLSHPMCAPASIKRSPVIATGAARKSIGIAVIAVSCGRLAATFAPSCLSLRFLGVRRGEERRASKSDAGKARAAAGSAPDLRRG